MLHDRFVNVAGQPAWNVKIIQGALEIRITLCDLQGGIDYDFQIDLDHLKNRIAQYEIENRKQNKEE